MFNHRPTPSPIQTVEFEGVMRPSTNPADAVHGVRLAGTITQKNGAGVRFLITSGRDGGATIFGNYGGKSIDNAWNLMEALTAAMREIVSQNDTEQNDLRLMQKGNIHFQINILGQVTTDTPLTGRAIRVTETLGHAVSRFRRDNMFLFIQD